MGHQPGGDSGVRHWRWDLALAAVTVVSALSAAAFAGVLLGLFDTAPKLPPATDFLPFWSAGRLAAQGGGAMPYDNHAIGLYERAHARVPGAGFLGFYYPPVFLLICLPLAALPYAAALLVFEALQAAVLWRAARSILARAGGARLGVLPVIAMPAFVMNAVSGQNGGLSAACLAGALLLLERRPYLAGACLGLLSFKPQLAAMAPLALIAAGRGRALAGAGGAGLLLAGLAFAVFGPAAWAGFAANSAVARHYIDSDPAIWRYEQSLYAQIRLAGGGLRLAYLLHGLVAAGAAAALLLVCRRRPGAAEIAVLATVALLVPPYLNDYDLPVTAVPLAWLAGRGVRDGFLPGEKMLLALLYIMPFAARLTAQHLGVTLAPGLLLCLLAMLLRRILAEARAGTQERCVAVSTTG